MIRGHLHTQGHHGMFRRGCGQGPPPQQAPEGPVLLTRELREEEASSLPGQAVLTLGSFCPCFC